MAVAIFITVGVTIHLVSNSMLARLVRGDGSPSNNGVEEGLQPQL